MFGSGKKEKEAGRVRKGIVAAVPAVFMIFISAGLLYRVGKDKTEMSRCGCGGSKKRLIEEQMLCREEKG